jgi:general secretion pathway protein C
LRIRKALFVSNLALVLVLGYVVFKTVMLPEPLEKPLAPRAAQGNVSASPKPEASVPVNYEGILQRNLFGGSGASTDANGNPADNSGGVIRSGTETGLELIGTIAGSSELARAIIMDTTTKSTELYKTGDSIAGAKIASIERNAVILVRNGEKSVLKLNVNRPTPEAAQPSPPAVANKSESGQNNTIRESNEPVRARAAAEAPSSSEGVLDQIVRNATIEPYVVNGQTEGLRITGLENLKMAQFIGLKDGDVIRKVNGQVLTSKQKAFQVFRKTRTQTGVEMELLRGNQEKNLSFVLR